jgi:branched-chain amino acid transport system ATP-binding protein
MSQERPSPLEVREISVRFGGVRALDDVSLVVRPQQIVGLIGPNGAGKTTLFNAVTGTVKPSTGRVFLFGHDVTTWPSHRRARLKVGRTFQRLELFGSLSVQENLVLGMEAQSRRGGLVSDVLALPPTVEQRADALERSREVLAAVGLEEYAETRAGDLPIGLSRMVELGRAVCGDPLLLLLDEPSSGLSREESVRLATLLRSARDDDGESILVVEHDMSFVMDLCDYLYVLDFGRLIAEGTPSDIRRDPSVQAAYLGEEMEGGSELEPEGADAAAPRG